MTHSLRRDSARRYRWGLSDLVAAFGFAAAMLGLLALGFASNAGWIS